MTTPSSVVVAGASAAGLGTAEALRRKGYRGRLTVLGAEPHPPYDRPPLSKQVLAGTWTPERARLRTREALDALDAEFLLGDPAVALDVAARTVRTASGRTVHGGAVVIATGLRPRTLPGPDGLAGVHVLRSLDDARALRAELRSAERAVVVGDGVLGAEIAATAHTMGVAVTLVGPQPAPMARQLGPTVAELLAALHREHGVRLRLGAAVDALTGHGGRVDGVRLGDGEVLPAEVVVVAVGAVPDTAWLTGSGLTLDDGVVCDAYCRAADGIYAAGDVARWHHPGLGEPLRLENRTNAVEQSAAVAGNILGEARPYAPIPYFWTDQFDARIHVHGRPLPGAEMTVVDGAVADRRFVAQYRHRGRVVAVLGWNMPKQARAHRQALLAEPMDAFAVPS
ncbi:NAD(P)/FAD-dependent oxidoreductase [Streptomyces rugosispiralis]|uniref:FAD-dependent oxidoreductase n=1 Tax=Streptomyces rugosispiralis TaxID=2967341 RepID=A0ABT1UQ31_9ACTN|nr:FAD-dependent oxidoreductase [Streptomyces rugosispiralis]MCQ8187235.1 FAD-dependent oxidoreductase [Streptomyces rugosispiralis]